MGRRRTTLRLMPARLVPMDEARHARALAALVELLAHELTRHEALGQSSDERGEGASGKDAPDRPWREAPGDGP